MHFQQYLFIVLSNVSVQCLYLNDITLIFFFVLLYCRERIEKHLTMLNSTKGDQLVSSITDKSTPLTDEQKLSMCLYLIESEFHFTGDGVWLEPIEKNESFMTPYSEILTPKELYSYRTREGPKFRLLTT